MAQAQRRGEGTEHVEKARNALDPDALLIGFARRFAAYKRAALILQDVDWLARLVGDSERPIQLVFAGEAHPRDDIGRGIIQQVARLTRDPRFEGKIVFVEDYDMHVTRHLVQGVDVWLNNPRRPLEASGTSGQKAVLNGGLNLSILDGWWAEAYDGSNGFAIGRMHLVFQAHLFHEGIDSPVDLMRAGDGESRNEGSGHQGEDESRDQVRADMVQAEPQRRQNQGDQ